MMVCSGVVMINLRRLGLFIHLPEQGPEAIPHLLSLPETLVRIDTIPYLISYKWK